MLTRLKGEPLAIIAALEALLAFALTLTSLPTNTQGIIMAAAVAVGGLWGAWATQDALLGAVTAVIKTGAVLVTTLHYSFSETSQATLIAAIAVVIGLFYQRQQTSPKYGGAAAPVDAPAVTWTPKPAHPRDSRGRFTGAEDAVS